MAVLSICALLTQGQDNSCPTDVTRKYYQQIVVINHSDIDKSTIVKTVNNTSFKVAFSLKTGKTGYLFSGSEAGSSYSGMFEKTTNELTGQPQYAHKVNYVGVGLSEAQKATLNQLDRGNFVVACQAKNGVVEIYGLDNGLINGDYTYDIQGGNGGSALVLQSDKKSLEPYIPYVYSSADPEADFDSLFAN